MARAKLLIIEGLDGAGKTEAVSLLRQALKERGESVVVFREPGGNVPAEKIRELTQSSDRPSSPAARALLFVSARKEIFDSQVNFALEGGHTVILDRSWPSTFAYSPKEEWDWIFNLHEGLGLFDHRHSIFFLDIDYATHVARLGRRKKDVIEEELATQFDFYRDRYLTVLNDLAPEANGKVALIDATRPLSEVFLQLMASYDEVYQ